MNRTAGPDNTENIIVSGESVSLNEFTSQADSVVFAYGDKEYSVHWWDYGGMDAEQAVKKLNREDEIELMVFRETDVAVAVRGKTICYLDVEEYNQWHWRNGISGIIGVLVLWVFLTIVLSINIFRYLKLDGLRYFDPNADR